MSPQTWTLKTLSSLFYNGLSPPGRARTGVCTVKKDEHPLVAVGTTMLQDAMEDGTGPRHQIDNLPNCIDTMGEGSQHAVVAIRCSTTIIDDGPGKKLEVCGRVWKTLEKRLAVPACFRLCRPR
ncbi:hypothetical protein Bbelb_355920 [Branchiostoma belcheri]|nr:hypothetical protein Bbelb_355920 [Branchiostoma belcheri]